MILGALSRRYAKAVFQLAQENRSDETTGEEMQSFSQILTTSPLGSVLSNPAYDLTKRRNILSEISKSLQLSPLMTRFLLLLLERQRLDYVPAIAAQYAKLLNDAKGRAEARVISATALEAAAREKLRLRLQEVSGKEVRLQSDMDPGLIGGIVIDFEGKTYDGSIRNHLEALKERIERGY